MTLDKTVSRLTTTIENMEMRSAKLMNGRVFAGARALYRAAGVDGKDFGKPIIAIANSFDEFLPGHVHLNKVGRLISEAIKEAGGIPREFNTMAVDDGIAMGHVGMKYSLVTRDLIADSTEAMAMAHQFDGLVMIPNCDKNVPGLLMAAGRLNVPSIVISAGAMLAGRMTNGRRLSYSDIAEAVDALGFQIKKSQVRTPLGAIKSVGDFTITIGLLTDITADIVVRVVAEAA